MLPLWRLVEIYSARVTWLCHQFLWLHGGLLLLRFEFFLDAQLSYLLLDGVARCHHARLLGDFEVHFIYFDLALLKVYCSVHRFN